MDIHNYKKRFERAVERVKESTELSDSNREIALKFKDYLLSEGIGTAKIERYLFDVVKCARMLNKPFPEANKDDIRRVIGELEQTSLAAETKKCFKLMLRKLYRFIRGIDEKGVYPDEVKWISIHISNNHKKLPEELLTDVEILKIVQQCKNSRDKALFATLAESGCRISEIGNMQIKHISFEEYGARLTVNGKTGMRKILVISSTPYLQEWLNNHPDNENPEACLWIGPNREVLCYGRMTAILKRAAEKAGIKKRIYPHLLRHSRATRLASVMPEASMKQYLGWTQSSKMAGIYIHMSGEDTDNAILKANGIEIKKETSKPIMEAKKCLRCKIVNGATNRFCKLCGLPLNEEAERILKLDTEKQQADEIMRELVKDKEDLKLLIEMIREKKMDTVSKTAN